MKNIILLFILLIPAFLFAQYPTQGNKSRLGYQTTGDGLIWRGVAADTAIKPRTTANAYFQLDTVNGVLRRYIATRGSWQTVSGGGGAGLTMPFDSITFNATTADPDTAELKYNADLETFVFGADGTTIEIGQKTAWYVKNQTGSTINKGTVVRASGTLGSSGRILISPMVIDGTVSSKYLLGITASDIANGSDGYVIHFGKLRKFNTSAWSDSDVLYAGAGGTLTATEPNPPNLRLPIAFVVHSHATNGILAIRIQTGNELHELHDVDTTGIQNNGLLTWNSSSQKWQASAPDYDRDSTNEIQTLSFASPLLAISSGNNVDLSPILTGYVTGSGTTNYVPKWSALTNLTTSNIFDNNTYAGVISRPWKFGEYTTAGLPTGVTGYHIYNTTTNGPGWYQGSRWAYGLESTFNRGTATRVPFFDANGQVTDNAAVTVNLTGVLPRFEVRGSIDQKTFVVRRTNSSQTANVFEVAAETGGTITSINALGYINATDLRLQNNGRTAFRGVTNFSTFADNVASTFFQVSNSSDGGRLLFTSENGLGLARLAFLSTGAYIYNGSFATAPAPVSQFAVINTNSAAQPMTIKLASPQNVDAFRITSNADVKLFHVENDGKVAIKNSTTAARDLDVNGEVRIRDLTTDTPTRIVGADADGDLGEVALAGGLSISGGVLTGANIYTADGRVSGNRYVKTSPTTNGEFFLGYFGQNSTDFSAISTQKNLRGLYISPAYQEGVGLISKDSTTGDYTNLYLSPFFSSLTTSEGTKYNTISMGSNNSSANSAKIQFSGVNNSSVNYSYAFPTESPGSGNNLMQWSGGVPSFKEIKRDTTIYINDADYDFSAAITTAQIGARYNRVIFWMTTTGAAGSDSEITLHTPDVNLMQVEYSIHNVDEAGGFTNVIRFGTNNAVDSTNGLVSSYFPAAGQDVRIRAGLRSGVYKYRYSN